LVKLLEPIDSSMSTSEAKAATLRTHLIQAGFLNEHVAPLFYGVRIVAALTVLVLSLAMTTRMQNANAGMSMALIHLGCGVGWVLPKMYLERRIKKRRENIRL